jgi:hypothetical protein
MKKELLLASALIGSLGVAGVAEAASMSMSGHVRNGVVSSDKDDGTDESVSASRQTGFSLSLSETTDGGTDISTGVSIADEGGAETDESGLVFTFNPSGMKLDLIEAGNSYATHLASVPSASGEQGISANSTNAAPSGLDYADASDAVGFELHSAADAFGVEGLKASVSANFNDDAAASTDSSSLENGFSIGASYVTTSGDTTVTIGGGIVQASSSSMSTTKDAANSMAVAATAATGNLTVGAGYASGDQVSDSTTMSAVDLSSVSVTTVGASYVSGDITFSVGMVDGEATDVAIGNTTSGQADSYSSTGASVDYAIASGVTGTIGFTDNSNGDEGTVLKTYSGSSWYIGANVSF